MNQLFYQCHQCRRATASPYVFLGTSARCSHLSEHLSVAKKVPSRGIIGPENTEQPKNEVLKRLPVGPHKWTDQLAKLKPLSPKPLSTSWQLPHNDGQLVTKARPERWPALATTHSLFCSSCQPGRKGISRGDLTQQTSAPEIGNASVTSRLNLSLGSLEGH